VEANTVVWSGEEDCRVTSPTAMTTRAAAAEFCAGNTITPRARENSYFGGAEEFAFYSNRSVQKQNSEPIIRMPPFAPHHCL